MRHLHISLFTLFLLSSMALFAQVPQSINYQAMAFDGTAVYANQTFDIRFTLHLNNATVYEETHFSTTSNSQGLFVLKIGQGVPSSGTFNAIDWSAGPYSLRTELDPGSGYVLISDHSFSSVPYALYAERSSLPVEDELSFNGDTLQIAQNGALLGQVLKWNGQDWVPDFDANQTYGLQVSGNILTLVPGGSSGSVPIGTQYTAGAGINIVGGTIVNTGDTDPSDDITTASNAGGDVSGVFSNLTVAGLQGNPVANTSPSNDDVLTWNALSAQWEPAPVSAGGAAVNVAPRLSGDGSLGSPLDIAPNGAINGDVLSWNGTAWAPATVSSSPITGGVGISVAGGVVSNTGDTNPSDDITVATPAGGDLLGLYPNPTVNGLAGFPLSSQAPGLNQVLKFNGTTWVPSNEAATTYNAGIGISISGTTINNTGDVDPSDDITITTVASGDLAGVYPNPVVVGINGFPFANTAPSSGQVYKWNGSQWTPTDDLVDDADADPANELQTLAIAGGNISISGGNSVPLPVYFEGTGIDITNNVITNTGDTDASDDITTATAAAGDVSGTFPNLTVGALQGNPLASTAPTTGQVLKWNGTQWAPAVDDAGPWTESAGTAIHDGDMSLQNAGGQTRVAAGISPNDRGFINVYDEFNNLKAGIQINASGQGEVFGDTKTFRMDHPEDPSKEIWYANLEGPEAGAYARGTAELVNGSATISFAEHFQLIATAENMTIMLTPLSGDSEGLAVIEKTAQGFVVKELRGGTGTYRFDWEAKCIRKGFENFEVIRDRK
ncbi:MAG: hypothetical protein AAF927_11935 [Bacteroidota bacterium]